MTLYRYNIAYERCVFRFSGAALASKGRKACGASVLGVRCPFRGVLVGVLSHSVSLKTTKKHTMKKNTVVTLLQD